MIPSFVSLAERVALRDFVALNHIRGTIVEIGAFAGASAVAILQGMDAVSSNSVFHVYDTFLFPDDQPWARDYRKRLPWNTGPSFLSDFQRSMTPYAHRFVSIMQGDARVLPLPLECELLHLDCAIDAGFHLDVSKRFFPMLVPGGTIIQQDEGYERAVWIRPAMQRLTDKGLVKAIGRVDTSVYYAVRAPITGADVDDAFKGLV